MLLWFERRISLRDTDMFNTDFHEGLVGVRYGKFRARLASAAICLLFGSSAAIAECDDRPGPGVDWAGCSKELLMLEGSDLSGANLDHAILSGTVFRSAKLEGANLQRAELVRTAFPDADLSGANLGKALASRADFSGARLVKAKLVKAEFQRVSFAGADLSGADLSDGDFDRNDFTGAKLAGADFTGAILPRSLFSGATLSGTSLTGAFLYKSRFEGVDLSAVKGLTQDQLDQTCGDQATKLPTGLSAPVHWPCGDD